MRLRNTREKSVHEAKRLALDVGCIIGTVSVIGRVAWRRSRAVVAVKSVRVVRDGVAVRMPVATSSAVGV